MNIKKIMIIAGLAGLTGCVGYQERYGQNETVTVVPAQTIQPVQQTVVQPATIVTPAPMVIQPAVVVPTPFYHRRWFRGHHHHHCR